MDIKEIRRFRLRKLIRTRFSGVSARFAEHIGKQPSYIARIFSDNPQHSRNIGESLAREIERACDLEAGYLDQPPTSTEGEGFFDHEINPAYANLAPAGSFIKIPLLDLPNKLHAAGDRESYSEGSTISSISLDSKWIQATLRVSDLENMRVFSAREESMSPTIKRGDLVMVDVGVTNVADDGVFILYLGDQLVVKRIQRALDGLRLISDNDHYPELLIPNELEPRISVRGRVLYIWSGAQV
ncbi:S24 family peptidase [Pseudomonas sp. HN8-3]|uniref:S24 family peptidase n=1 Tax=Pseudomonas sp. HN8-3 TaxID=2886361 RepID=UPI001E32A771|nr:S24 family peptidase [Pseudomonas sp. HN8-3]UEH06697.1 S24 family peptidase [Pseudomonas sp. HN8-3]